MSGISKKINPPSSKAENAFELTSLFEFSTVVNASLDLKFIFNHFLLTLMGKFLSLKGIVLLERRTNVFMIENVKGLSTELINLEWKLGKIPNRIIFIKAEKKSRFPWLKYFQELGVTVLIPLSTRNRIVGVVGFAPLKHDKKFSEKETLYIKSIFNIAAVSIEKGLFIQELGTVNRQLDRKIQELNTLFEVGKEFNTVMQRERLIKLLIFSVMGQIGVNRYFLCLEEDGDMRVVAEKLDRRNREDVCRYIPYLTKPKLVSDLNNKNEKPWRLWMEEIGIEVVIPLQLQQQTRGLLALGEKLNKDNYTEKDLEFLSSLGNLAMISLDNIRLFNDAIEKQRMEDELLIAREIQKGLLPSTLPKIPSMDISAVNISSKQVGGDYYDVIQLSSHHFVIAIGDVSGKGTPASLLMASLQATIRALVPLGLSLSELTKRVNDLICDNTTSGRFITFFWGIIDTESMKLNYVNAGHNPPVLVHSDGSMELLEKGGIILGIMKDVSPYVEGIISLHKDDALVLFTDGVSESMNCDNIEFSDEKLRSLIIQNRKNSANEIMNSIVDSIKKHAVDTSQSDDITLLVIKA
ncbi:MAG: SpoIIE family protein phosphatase [Ignavibacteriales bacterium]|nr:SpoIIE family protein phosphatase [Ignavibacteriales bacterium]